MTTMTSNSAHADSPAWTTADRDRWKQNSVLNAFEADLRIARSKIPLGTIGEDTPALAVSDRIKKRATEMNKAIARVAARCSKEGVR